MEWGSNETAHANGSCGRDHVGRSSADLHRRRDSLESARKWVSSVAQGVPCLTAIRLSGPDAWDALVKGQNTRWSDDITRFGDSPSLVAHTPKFELSSADSVFCFG